MKINLNQRARVILTQTGADIYNKNEDYWSKIMSGIPSYRELKPVLYKKGGDIMEAQLWHLFELFGEHVGMGRNSPFEACEIEVLEE